MVGIHGASRDHEITPYDWSNSVSAGVVVSKSTHLKQMFS